MRFGLPTLKTGHDTRSWPVLSLLLVVVLMPTLGAIWFMNQAMRNERLAVRQKLDEVYRIHLVEARQALNDHWRLRLAVLDTDDAHQPAPLRFVDRARTGLAESVVIRQSVDRSAYPTAADPGGSVDLPAAWSFAERVEGSGRYAAAASRYAEIALAATSPRVAALALRAQARCLLQAGRPREAVEVLVHQLDDPRFADAFDEHGRLIVPSAQLLAIRTLFEIDPSTIQPIVDALAARLNDYGPPFMPAAQRRFLMRRLHEAATDAELEPPTFDTLDAEILAERYLQSMPPKPAATVPQESGLPDIWHVASADGSIVALFDRRRLIDAFQTRLGDQTLPADTELRLDPPGTPDDDAFAVTMPVGDFLPDWRLVLRPEDQSLFTTAAAQRLTAYRLTGGVLLVAILVLAAVLARIMARQLRLTRLKNDLLATVSHELKTPLASMRLLVETLLDDGVDDHQQVRDYLHLIAAENSRLSRLVDNFLTFSRLERGQHRFARESVDAAAVVDDAVRSVAERFAEASCRFDVEVEPDLPAVDGDHDALVTVLLNLLDNAFKYSTGDRHIVLRAKASVDRVTFAVRDHGIGMSRRVSAKIFDRFYQVDRRLSRSGSGCGLGLSIVRSIVDAHGGTVTVDSRPDEGSTFTVSLPAAAETASF